MNSVLIGKNARRMRCSCGMTQAQVARKARISVPTYSKIESGKASPRMETLYRVASAMGAGVQDFLVQVRELHAVRFRASRRLKKREQVLAKAATWLDDFNFVLNEVEDSKVKHVISRVSGELGNTSACERPVEAARLARKAMRLDDKEPIHDITGLFAANGIKVLTYSLASDAFFGMSIGQSEGGPAIVVNVWERIPVERWIFSAAHELGHLLLHLNAYDVEITQEDEQQEKEANVFASHFLMPQNGFQQEWQETAGLPLWDRILKVKRIYHVSYKTILYRLLDMGAVSANIWQKANSFLRTKYPKQNISKSFEPEKLQEYDFVTDWLDRLVRNAYEKKAISRSRASEILGVSLEDMRQRANSWAEDRSASQAT